MIARSAEDICNLALLRSGTNLRISSITGDNTPESQACQTCYDENRRNLIMDLLPAWAKKRQALTPLSGVAYNAARTFAKGDLTQYGEDLYRSLLDANTNNQPDLAASAAWWVQVTRDDWAYVCPLPDDCIDPRQIWERPSVSPFATTPLFTGLRDPDDAFNLRNPLSDDRIPYAIENANDGTDGVVLLTDVDTPMLAYIADVTNPSAYTSPFVQVLAWLMASDLAVGLKGDDHRQEFCLKTAIAMAGRAVMIDKRDQQEDPEPVSEFEAARRGLNS